MKRSLLLGCGNSRVKKMYTGDDKDWKGDLITIDMDPNCGGDHVIDIGFAMTKVGRFLPFPDQTFDELAAYDALEHWGRQGDWRGFFDEFGEYHRVLKPGGTFGIIVPVGADALADPGHTRFFNQNYFWMLNRKWYEWRIGNGDAVTDYRWAFDYHFYIKAIDESSHHLSVMLVRA
jgi:hypothetical protein